MPEKMKECEVASWWWASNLSPAVAPAISNGQIVTFQKCLQDILEHKYESHWYIRDPERGSGFRSIMFEGHSVDGVLLQAARHSGIQNLKQRLTTQCIMWVDPGAVKVVYSHSPKKQHVLYQAAPTSANMNNPKFVMLIAIMCCYLQLVVLIMHIATMHYGRDHNSTNLPTILKMLQSMYNNLSFLHRSNHKTSISFDYYLVE